MPTGVQLSDMVRDLRAECGHSLQVAHGVNSQETLEYYLRRSQEMIYAEADWPNLRLRDYVTLNPGQRFYSYPVKLSHDNINKMYLSNGSCPQALLYGISPQEAWDSDQGVQSWPVQKWQDRPDLVAQFEVWPMPASGGDLIADGTMRLKPLVAPSDVCTLDSTVVILRAAAEILAHQRSPDAEIKMQMANNLMRSLRSQQSSQRQGPWSMIGSGDSTARPGIDYIP